MECLIVGGGPVGCLLASLLTSRGLQCVVYEKRSDPRTLADAGKSINLALSCRGLTALRLLGDDQQLLRAMKEAVPMPGRYIHALSGSDSYQPYSDNAEEFLHSVNRRDLNNDLCTVAEKRGVKMVFGHPIERIDFDGKIAYFRNTETGETVAVPFMTLWGADGSNSRVRKELERVSGVPSKTARFESGYKEFEVLPKDGKPQFKVQEAFHVWPRESPTFFIALPNADMTYTCTLFNPAEGPEHIGNYSDEEVVELFRTQFPDAFEAMGPEKILSDHHANPFGGLYSVDAPAWRHNGDVVIIGDAAHGVVPYLGLGINSGFEGCRHVLNLMDRHKKEDGTFDWEEVFAQFNKYKASTDALREAAIENAYELHQAVGDAHFLFEKEVERILQKQFPRNFIESHALFSFTNVPMVDCGKRIKLQREITVELCKGKQGVEEIDWERAKVLIEEKLGEDLFAIKDWYEV